MKKVLIIDTSIMCVWLQVPGKETCGKDGNIRDEGLKAYEPVQHIQLPRRRKNET